MKRNLLTIALSLALVGTIAVGCGDSEDYATADTTYATMNDATLAAHTSALEAFGEMNTAMSSMTVADDWSDAHKAAFANAQAKMGAYQAKFDEGAKSVASLGADLEAAKKEGREAYDAKLAEATQWHADYNAWLAEYNTEVEAWRAQADAAEGSEPWWYTTYSTNTEAEAIPTDGDETVDATEGKESSGLIEDVEAAKADVEDAADKVEDAVDKVEDAAGKVEDAADKVGEAAGGLLNKNDGE